MKVRTARGCSYPRGFIGGRELQKQWAQGSRENIEEYLWILLVNQAIIWNEGSPERSSYENLMLELVKSLTQKEERSESQSKEEE
jgi:hypothetical protein